MATTKTEETISARLKLLTVFILLAFLISGLYKFHMGAAMSIAFVYLIPDDYFGPVFIFFGQKDGGTPSPDPLGQAVLVPENGVIKIKEDAHNVIGKARNNERNVYWVSVSKNGARKVMKVHGNTQQDKEGNYFDFYFDENGQPHQHPTLGQAKPFYYFSAAERNELMIFGHGGCKHQEFKGDNDPDAISPACGKFLVISPNQYRKMPRWMWDDTHRLYSSVNEFVEEADDRVKKKKEFYKLP